MADGKEGAAHSADVCLEHEGQRVVLKWHKLRRGAHEPPFSLENLRAGLALGASLEVDARLLGDGTWVCLHDDVLDEETTGIGAVSAADAKSIAAMRIAGASYPPPLLADVVAEIGRADPTSACVQIDLKEPSATLTAAAVESFAALVAPVAKNCLLSGTDWAAVEQLGSVVPGLRLGYDPYEAAEGMTFADAASLRRFVEAVFTTAPEAAAFYLYHRFVAEALELGVDSIALLKRRGALVDVWTLDPDLPGIETILPRMIAVGAAQITTNDPPGMARLWEGLAASASGGAARLPPGRGDKVGNERDIVA